MQIFEVVMDSRVKVRGNWDPWHRNIWRKTVAVEDADKAEDASFIAQAAVRKQYKDTHRDKSEIELRTAEIKRIHVDVITEKDV